MASRKKQKAKENGKRAASKISAVLFGLGIVALGIIVVLANSFAKKQSTSVNAASNGTNAVTSPDAAAASQSDTNSVAQKEPDEIVADLITDANRDLAAGRVDRAVEKLRKAVQTTPDDEDAHYNLGIALAAAGKNADARKEYERALEIFPDYGQAHNNLGNLLMKQNDFAGAIEQFQKALAINPDDANAENNLGTCLARQGKIAEALPHFAEAVRRKPDYLAARLNLANGYIALSRFDEAARELNAALTIDPGFEPAQKALARLRTRAPR